MTGPRPKPLPVTEDQDPQEAAEFKPLRHPDTYDKSVALHEYMERHEDLSGYDEDGRMYQ